VFATYTFWRWLKPPKWSRAVNAEIAFGICLLTKSSWIVLFGLWPLLSLFWRLARRNECSTNPPVYSFIYRVAEILTLVDVHKNWYTKETHSKDVLVVRHFELVLKPDAASFRKRYIDTSAIASTDKLDAASLSPSQRLARHTNERARLHHGDTAFDIWTV